MINLGITEREVFAKALEAMTSFRETFGRPLDEHFVAALHVALNMDIMLTDEADSAGYDAVDKDGKRYQIKYRSPDALNVDVKDFDFDYLVLVNLNENYQLAGMWKMPALRAEGIFAYKDDSKHFQTTQVRYREEGEQVA